MRNKIIAGNWKMNKTLEEAKKAWLKQPQTAVQAFIDEWEKAFDWGPGLVGGQPLHLLAKMDAFYLYVPMSTTNPNV